MDNALPQTAAGKAYTRYVLFMIFLVMVFSTCDRTIVSVLVDDIRRDLALDDRQMGFIIGSAFALVHFLAVVPIARWADRWSHARVMAIGLFGWSIMTALCGAAQNFFQLALARMGVGVGEAAGGPPGQAIITQFVPPDIRGRAMSVITLGGLVGLSFGVIYGGWASQEHGWRFALISVGLAGTVLAVLFWFTVYDRRPAMPEQHALPELKQTLKRLAANRTFVILLIAACAVSMGTFGRALWEPTFLRRIYDMSPAQAGAWYFLIGPVPAAVGAVISGYLLDRFAQRDARWYGWLPALGAAALVPLVIAFYLYPADQVLFGRVPTGFVFSALASLLSSSWVPATMCLGQMLAPPRSLAVTAAVWSMLSNFIGYGLGPLIVGDLNVRFEPVFGEAAIRYSLVAITVMTIVGAIAYLKVADRLGRDFSAQ